MLFFHGMLTITKTKPKTKNLTKSPFPNQQNTQRWSSCSISNWWYWRRSKFPWHPWNPPQMTCHMNPANQLVQAWGTNKSASGDHGTPTYWCPGNFPLRKSNMFLFSIQANAMQIGGYCTDSRRKGNSSGRQVQKGNCLFCKASCLFGWLWKEPSGPRLSRHPSRCSSQWRMVPLGLPEGGYKGPDGLGSTQWWAEIATTPSARLSLGSA